MSQSTVDTILGVMLAALIGLAVWAIKRQVAANEQTRAAIATQAREAREAQDDQAQQFRRSLAELSTTFGEKMQEVAVNLAELNTGASAGARAAISDLREELRSSFREVSRDVAQLRNEHDGLAERHNNSNATVVQLAERVNGTRELLNEVRRDLQRRPSPERKAE